MPTTRRPRQATEQPQSEPEGTPEPETTEPESGKPVAEESAEESMAERHARELAESEAEEAEPETPPGVELSDEKVTCKRCGNTYARDIAPDDFTCTDRRCPLKP